MVRLVQTVHLSCTNTNTIYKQTKMRFNTTHVTYEFHRVRPKLVKISTISKQSSTRPSHLRVPSVASKTIYEPVVRLTQTKNLSCTDINIVSKQIKIRFHMTHFT
jgi:hypothetical protein